MKSLRTPEERFSNLPNFPYKPQYIEKLKGYEDLRLHYIDEGPRDSKVVFLCLHGEPTWSYLYRKIIPVFLESGHRIVAPDFFGFGRSDKPIEDERYTFNFHRNTILSFIKHLDLHNITLVCQDWGGIIGLTLPVDMPNRFSRLLVMNTILATGDQLPKGFLDWRDWSLTRPDMAVEKLMMRTCPHLSDEELAAYKAPFPDITYKAGVRRFPPMVPSNPDMEGAQISQRAQDYLSNKWSGDSFMAVGVTDPVFGPPVMNELRKVIKGCPEPYKVMDGGHFLQEWGDIVAKEALKTFKLT